MTNQPPPQPMRTTTWATGGHEPEEYWLKNFEKAIINDLTLSLKFQGKKVEIRVPLYSSSLLQDIKAYIEEATKYCKKPSL